jgi:hypothetical protein
VIKTLIRLAIAALLANASWQIFNAYWAHVKFGDAIETTTYYRGEKTDEQLRARILELAGEFGIPVSDENMTIQFVDNHTVVDTSYLQPVRVVPGYTYLWPFTVHTDTTMVKAAATELDFPK